MITLPKQKKEKERMKVILTEAEKKAATWLELDDESVGKLVKATAFKLAERDEKIQILTWSAALVLCSAAAKVNAETFKQTVEGLTIEGKNFGTWEITIKKVES